MTTSDFSNFCYTPRVRRSLLGLLLAAAACAPKTAPEASKTGKAYFAQLGCLACHRVGGEGSAVGPDLTLVGFRYSAAWLDRWMQDPQAWKPGTLMPNSRLSPDARRAVVSYMAGLKGQDWPKGGRPWDAPALADPVAKGRVIYARAGCAGCHGLAGAGGYPNNNVPGGRIPALRGLAGSYSPRELVEKIRRGVPAPQKADPKGPDPLIGMPAWGGLLDDAELDAVASYLFSLPPDPAEKAGW